MTPRYAVVFFAAAAMLALAGANVTPAFAQGDMDTPAIGVVAEWTTQTEVTITAGPSGAPSGFTVWWMKESDYVANGNEWFLYGDPRQGEAWFWGTPTLNTNDGLYTTFALGPNESITVQIGDLWDEDGVTATYPAEDVLLDTDGELQPGTSYMFCAYANGTAQIYQSGLTVTLKGGTHHPDCTRSKGYWKNHPSAWPASCLPMTLGLNSYTQAQLLQILNKSVGGNGAISLAKQLIAAKLNVCTGSTTPACIATADTKLAACGSNKVPPIGTCSLTPSSTSSTTECLDKFNTSDGNNCATPTLPSTWGKVKTVYR